MFWQQAIDYAILSDIGFRRQNNQDSCGAIIASDETIWRERGHVFIVADGMGGHAVGELASKIAVDTVPHTFRKLQEMSTTEALRKSILDANDAIYQRGQQNRDFLDMGTTCTTLVLSPLGAIAGHVGDSRLYRVRDHRIDQLTFDHSVQWEMMRQGRLAREEILQQPKNVITRCLGPESSVEVDLEGPFPTEPGDVYVLCSDGLSGMVTDEEIGLIARELPPTEACRMLVNLANLRGGSDNITVIVVRLGKLPPNAKPSVPEETAGSATDWRWLAGMWGVASLLVLSVLLFLFGRHVQGGISLGLFVVAAIAVVVGWIRTTPPAPPAESAETLVYKPYRTRSLRLGKGLLNRLNELIKTLERTARDEAWEVDWSAWDAASAKSEKAMAERRPTEVLQEIGRAMQALMNGILLERRRMEQVARWGKAFAVRQKAGPEHE